MIYICITQRWSTEFQVLWAIAKNRKQKGMNLICAAGSHLDPSTGSENSGSRVGCDDADAWMRNLRRDQEEYVQMLA